MSDIAKPIESNSTPINFTDFLLAQKTGYLHAVGEGEAQKNAWTLSMGNEAGGWFKCFSVATPNL